MKTFSGVVISNKMKNTIVVKTTRRIAHPLYKKILKRSSKFKADTGNLKIDVGDVVKVAKVKPISKNKHFRVVEKTK